MIWFVEIYFVSSMIWLGNGCSVTALFIVSEISVFPLIWVVFSAIWLVEVWEVYSVLSLILLVNTCFVSSIAWEFDISSVFSLI